MFTPFLPTRCLPSLYWSRFCGSEGGTNRMAIRSVGINQPWSGPSGLFGPAGDLESLKGYGADFVELMPAELGVILGGDLDPARQRIGPRDARHSLRQQLAAERLALRQAGDIAGELGVEIAVENYYPELPIVRGAVYDYSVWPSELAEQISAVDHPAVGICLDVGHAALASEVFGFDYIEECAAIAPLVRHVHLHDNLQKTNLTGEPPLSEHPVYGLGDLHLPPGRGTIPLEDLFRRGYFPRNPTCCVELCPERYSLVPEALRAARKLTEAAIWGRVPA